jgi:hypothetical protein
MSESSIPNREQYAQNKEVWKERNKKYYLKNKDKVKKAVLEYQKNNLDKRREYARKRHRKNYVPIPIELHKPRGSIKAEGMRSGFERTLAAQMRAENVSFEYETLKIPYTLEGVYNPDFILENGIIIEAKGLLDRDSKRKMIAVKKQHPELDIRIVFMAADRKIPGGKQTHAQWADKAGYIWADGKIPEEWTK